MPDEIKPVQPEVVAKPTTPTAAPAPAPEPAKQPSLDEIASKLSLSMDDKISKLTESFRREMQSTKDKSIAEVERARRQAEITLQAIRSVAGDDPDPQTRIQMATLQAQVYSAQQEAQQEEARRRSEGFFQAYQDKVTKILKRFDVDPTDKRINWNTNEPDLLERLDKITESAEAIHRANKKEAEEKYSSLDKRVKEMEGKSKEANKEANSVNTGNASGSASDEAIRNAYIKNPENIENRKRYMELRARRK